MSRRKDTPRGSSKAGSERVSSSVDGGTGPLPPWETVYLKEKEFREKVIAVEQTVKAEYQWDTGIAIGRYLAGLKEGKILARVCYQCRRTLVPPRMFCEQCFRPTDEWAEVKDTGVVNTFSICYVTWDMQSLEVPELPAVIEIDGASKGIGIMHKLGNVSPEGVYVGMKVRALWKPAEEREGSILDIRFWEPIESRKVRPIRSSAKAKARAPRRPLPDRSKKATARRRRTGGGT